MLVGKLSAALVVFAIAIYFARSSFRTQFDWHKMRETLSMGAMLVPHQLMAGGLIAGDRFILQHYRDLREIGLYAIAYTFGMVMSLVTLSLSQSWTPIYFDLARSDEGQRRLGRICSELFIGMAAVACFGALIAQDFIARFLNERYVTAGRVVPWIIGAYLAHAMFSIFSLAVLQGKRTQWLMLVSFVALTVNTALNFALIPIWGNVWCRLCDRGRVRRRGGCHVLRSATYLSPQLRSTAHDCRFLYLRGGAHRYAGPVGGSLSSGCDDNCRDYLSWVAKHVGIETNRHAATPPNRRSAILSL